MKSVPWWMVGPDQPAPCLRYFTISPRGNYVFWTIIRDPLVDAIASGYCGA